MKELQHPSGQPQVIFLDAVGTLFGVRGSVGTIYAEVAAQFGVTAEAESLDRAFYQTFKTTPALAFAERDRLSEREYKWWQELAVRTFTTAELIEQFADFGAFFAELYRVFAMADSWCLYTDTLPALQHWQEKGIELGVISNFDSRIFKVLDNLNLSEFFQSVTISSLTGAAKPDRQIFEAALNKHQCDPQRAWHIGDSPKEDYEGAKALGLIPFLIDPSRP
jgi:putative hydrolase of the HAD superfamily